MTPTLATAQAQRARLLAQRAEGAYSARRAQLVPRSAAIAAGLALRRHVRQLLQDIGAHWLQAAQGRADETSIHHALSEVIHQHLSALPGQLQPLATAAGAPLVLADAYARGAAPRQLLSVSQWAARYRELKSGTNSPGPWRNELTPYLTEIQDALSEHSPVRSVAFIKSSGVGGTEAMYNWLGYVMHHLRTRDLLIVVPTLELRERSLNPRLAKMLDESPSLKGLVPTGRRDRANRADVMEFGARQRIIKAGANSPDSLRSDHIQYVICDEVDAFPWDVGGEGDPMTLIENRQRTYTRAKSYFVSTPTRQDGSLIERLFQRSDQRHYHVPCPHCGELQTLDFTAYTAPEAAHGLKWRLAPQVGSDTRPQVAAAWFVCKDCGAEIDERHKPDMLAQGRWVPKHPQRRLQRGYHINALYSPTGLGLGWAAIAQKWLDVQGDSSELKAFVNTYLGLTWAETGDSIEPATLLSRLEDYPPLLPGIVLSTAGVDVQKDRLEATLVDWDATEQGWVRDHHILPGDTTQPQVWDDLADLLNDNHIHLACIDAGYNTSIVQDFCDPRPWAIPTKGIPGQHRPLVEPEQKRKQRLRQRRKRGKYTEPIGVDQGKALLYARLKLQQPGPGYIHFPNLPSFDDEYFAQLAAEKLVTKVRGTRPFAKWVQTRPRNEALDCMVLNLAAFRLAPLLRGKVSLGASAAPPEANPGAATTAAPAASTAPPRPALQRPTAQPGAGRLGLGGIKRRALA